MTNKRTQMVKGSFRSVNWFGPIMKKRSMWCKTDFEPVLREPQEPVDPPKGIIEQVIAEVMSVK